MAYTKHPQIGGSRVQALMLEAFLEVDPELRHMELQGLHESQAKALIDTWISSGQFRLTDALVLPEPFIVWVTQKVKARGLTFVVGINPDWEPTEAIAEQAKPEWIEKQRQSYDLGLPNENDQRRFRQISEPVPLPAHQAIQALSKAGPHGSFPHERGRLREYSTKDHMELLAAQQPSSPASPAAKKNKAQARA